MKAFKLFFKIAKKNFSNLIIQLAIFLAIFAAVFMSFNKEDTKEINVDKIPIMLINEDSEDPISNSLVRSLEGVAEIKTDIPNDPDSVSDALFFEEIQHFITIPKGFGESLRENKEEENPLIVQKGLNESPSMTIDGQISQFISLYEVNKAADLTTENEETALAEIENTFQNTVTLSNFGEGNDRNQSITMFLFFNLMCYYLFTTVIAEIGFIMVSMDNKLIRSREISSGYPQIKRSMGLYTASMVTTVIIWIIALIFGIFFIGTDFFTTEKGQLLILSSFIHMIAVGSISIFIGTIAPNKGFVNFSSTVIGLAIAFSSGVFLSPELIWNLYEKSPISHRPFGMWNSIMPLQIRQMSAGQNS